jgi:taurine transport system permease protein
VTLGLASGYNRYVRAVFDPVVEFYQSIPPLAYYTLIIIWFGIWEKSKITVLFLVAFAPIFIASMSGVKSVRRDYIDGALTLGADKLQVFFHVILPASLPYVFTGLRTAMAMSYGTLVAAEMVASVSGIAWLTFDAGRYNRTDIVFMGILIMGITSLILDRCIRWVESRVVPWKGRE